MMGRGTLRAQPDPDSVCLQGLVHTGQIAVHSKASDTGYVLPNHMLNQAAPMPIPHHLFREEGFFSL